LQFRQLGTSGISVSTVCLGLWNIVGDETWGAQDETDAIQAIETALESGITFLDTAESYGNGYSEELLGRVLGKARRKEVVLATKVLPNHLKRASLIGACQRSLARLKTDYIDLYIVHWPNPRVPIEETVAALDQLVDEGKVRAVGVSNHGPRDLATLLPHRCPASNQLAYNLLFRAIEFEVAPLCVENRISITPYSSLAQALLTGKFANADEVPEGRARTRHFSGDRPQARHGESGAEEETFEAIARIRRICDDAGLAMSRVALAWLSAQPGVTSVIAGARNAEQARANAAAADIELGDDTIAALSAATDALKRKLGPNADMWSREPRIQ